ncbi:MAG: S41 family peptidase [Armatimonadota bacterium]
MKRKAILTAFMATVIAGSFLAGIFEPELRAQSGLPASIFSLKPGSEQKELDPVNTYSKVLQLVNERFYGETPGAKEMTYYAIRGMLNSLDDPYTRFLDPEEYRELREDNLGEFEGIGATLGGTPTKEGYVRVVRPIPGGPADKAGLKKGDLITKVDGKSVQGMSVNQAVKIIRGKSRSIVRLTVKRSGVDKPLDISIERAPVEYPIVEYVMKEGNIGYVSLSQFNELSDQKMTQAIQDLEAKGMKGLILDLRGNPGGLLDAAIDISSRFVEPGKGVVYIVESGERPDLRRTNARKHLSRDWPLVVLVNRTSASASEIVAGAVKDNQAGTVMGTTTFGKGLVQTVMPLEGNSAAMITTHKYLTPSGKDINRGRDQRGGVHPDIEVDVTEEDWLKGKDPQLTRALEFLHQKVGYKAPAKPQAGAASAKP